MVQNVLNNILFSIGQKYPLFTSVMSVMSVFGVRGSALAEHPGSNPVGQGSGFKPRTLANSSPGIPLRGAQRPVPSTSKIYFKKVRQKVRHVAIRVVSTPKPLNNGPTMNHDFDFYEYCYTSDTICQDAAQSMTAAELDAAFARLKIRADRRVRHAAHRNKLRAGAVRLAPRLQGTDEEHDLANLTLNEVDPLAGGCLDTILRDAEYHASRRVVDAAAARALSAYLERAAVGQLDSPAIDYYSAVIAIGKFNAQQATAGSAQ